MPKRENLVNQKFGHLTVIELDEETTKAKKRSYWFCNCECGTQNIEINGHNLVSRGTQSCGCISSKGEEKIAKILKDNNIDFLREYRIDNLILSTGGKPRFDFAVLKNGKIKYFIEYQGEQHFRARGNIFTEEKVKIIQQRDKEKKEYCEKNNIPLFYINYTDFNSFGKEDVIKNDLL